MLLELKNGSVLCSGKKKLSDIKGGGHLSRFVTRTATKDAHQSLVAVRVTNRDK